MKRNEIIGEISDRTLKNYSQDAHTQVQGAKFGKGKGTPDAEKIIAKREKGMAAAGKRQQARRDAERANYKRPEPAKTSSGPQDWYGQNRYMGDSVEQGVAEGSEGFSIEDMVMDQYRNGNEVWEIASNMGMSEDEVQDIINDGEQGVAEGRSDYVGDAIEGLRMAKPGLEKEDFLDELYSYIDAEMGNRAAEAAFADKDSYDDWYESYADAMDENANMLKVAKDDDQQTILQNPSTGVQTQIDKTNPNAPSLTKDETTGKLKLAAPANGAASAAPKPDLKGKDVEVATESADLAAVLRIAGIR